MKTAKVAYYDGKISTRRDGVLSRGDGCVTLRSEAGEQTYPLSGLVIPPAVGAVRRTIRLPDGGVCEIDDPEFLAELERVCGQGRAQGVVHRWEKSLPLALTALAVTMLVVVLFVRYGVPALATRAALALPAATETNMGRESLATLDKFLMKPSTLDKQRQAELTALFQRVAGSGGAAAGYRLEFRSCPPIGANALALPSGIVVLTDDLVSLAKHDDELAAVFAHELGHVRGRHILRHIMQSSVAGLIVATLTGDLVSITSLAATLPTVMVDASFSREFEREADAAALAWMKSAGVPPRRYAEILGRLQAQLDVRQGATASKNSKVRNYLSTHPDTGDRIRRILRAGE